MLHVPPGSSRVLICLLALLVTPAAARAQLVTAPGAGVSPLVRVIETNGTERVFHAYHPAFTGGVRVALGDVTGDGVLDIVTAPGPGGGPHVRVWNGVDLTEVGGFFAYDPAFPGGVWVAAGDVDGDGRADIITGAGAGGGPHVRVWSGTDFHEIGGFFAYHPAFPGGVTVAAGDVNGDGRADIITGAGPGGGPHVRVWNATDFSEIGGFFAYHPAFPGGVFVAAGDVTNDGRADIITGAGPGGGPHVRVWNATDFSEIGGFFAYDPAFSGGVHVAAIDLTGDGRAEVITGLGPGGFPISSIWNGADLSLLGSYLAFEPSLQVGVFVASVGKSSALRFTSGSSTSFIRGAAGTFTVTTAGGAAPPALTVTGALPGGVQFTDNGNGTATLAGTPGAGTAGTYSLTFTANNGTAPPVTQTFTLTVNDAPAITSANSASFNVGSVGSSFTITATGTPTPTISISGALPDGITFTDNGDGTATLAGTASAGTGGTYPLVITATNGIGSAATQNFTLSIQQGAAITSGNATTFVAGAAGTFMVTTTGSPVATSIAHTGALPSGVSFTNNGNGTATLAGMPGTTTGGTYLLTITASNGVGSPAVQNFTLTVNQAPAITSANSATFLLGTPGSFTVTTTGFPAASIARTGDALPGTITFSDNLDGTATLSGTAAAPGTFNLIFTASNGVGSPAVQNFTLTAVCPVVTLTPASGTLAAGTYGQAYNQAIAVVGGGLHTFALTAGALPSGMGVSSGGVISGTPTNTGTFNFTVTATESNSGCTGSASYSIQVSPDAADEIYSGGVGNTQMVVAPAPFSLTPAVLVVGSVLSNDAGPGTLSAGPASIVSTSGGAVALGTNGAFVYTPATGFAGPSDTFVYTLTDGNGLTDTAAVTVNLSGRVWYVNNSGVNGDGRSHSPFNALNNAQAPSFAGDVIFVHAGVGTTPGAIALKTSQTLWGNAHGFSLNALSIGPGGTPVLGGSVTLADGVLVRALDISSGAADAIVGTNLAGTETIESVNITGGGTGYNLTNVGGTFNISNGSITGVSGTDVRIMGGTGAIAVGSSITNTSGRSVNIENRTGGSVGFTAPISDTDQGILLSNNGTTPVLFLGGLTLNTGANAAFTATGGGRVTATQDNVSIVNTITTTTGTALNLTDYSIGTFGLTFRSISSDGGSNTGIILDNTGTNAGLTITGNGSAGSGGTIANKTGADGSTSTGVGIYLNNTRNVSLSWMQLNDFANSAITGRSVEGFTLQDSVINGTIGTSSGAVEGPINFGLSNPGGANGLQGTGLIRNTKVSGGVEHNLEFYNQSGSMTLTIDGVSAAGPAGDCRITSNSVAFGSDGILIEMQDTAAATLVVQRCYFNDNKSQAVQVNALSDTSVTVTLDSLVLTKTTQGNEGLILSNGSNSQMTAMVSNNTSSGFGGTHIFVGQTPGNATALSQLDASILDNVVTMPATATNHGIVAFLTSTVGQVSQARLRIDGNTVNNNSLSGTTRGIIVDAPDSGTSPTFHATVTNNTVAVADNIAGVAGLVVQSRQSATAFANIHSNTVTFPNGNPGVNGLRARQVAPATYNLEQSASCVGTAAAVLSCRNPAALTEVLGTIAVVGAGSTILPITP